MLHVKVVHLPKLAYWGGSYILQKLFIIIIIIIIISNSSSSSSSSSSSNSSSNSSSSSSSSSSSNSGSSSIKQSENFIHEAVERCPLEQNLSDYIKAGHW